ncbi:MAG TPA: polysaccharide biosynthesis protein [Clostridiales bacterium]|nr:polysaccharide biosynthesis protein [Clostridiales bacterium]
MVQSRTSKMASGAIILILANFIVKLVGVVYKIPLTNILGDEGMGYLSSAYEIYQLILAICASGGALAMSRMVAESYALGHFAEVRKLFRLTLLTMFVVGLLGTLVMFFGGRAFAIQIDNEPAVYSIMALSPAVLILSTMSVFRGYFQGRQQMLPTAVSQVLESLVKLGAGIGLALWVRSLGKGQEFVAAAGILGTTLSTLAGFLVMLALFYTPRFYKTTKSLAAGGGPVRSSRELFFSFWKIAIPLAIGAMVVNLTGVLDLFLIYDRLAYLGLDQSAVNAAYGGYKGYAQTLFNLPPSIIASLNMSIIPALSAARAKQDIKRLMHLSSRSVKLVAVLAAPCAIGLTVLAEPIQKLLFPARLSEIAVTTPLLQILGIASFWVCLASLTTAMLQSLGQMRLPIFSLAVGSFVKLAANYILVGTKGIGIYGAPIGTLLCYITMFSLNMYFIKRRSQLSINFFSIMAKPALASIFMGAAGFFGFRLLSSWLPERLATVLILFLSAAIYGVFLLLIRGLHREDVMLFPGGRKMAAILTRIKLLRD